MWVQRFIKEEMTRHGLDDNRFGISVTEYLKKIHKLYLNFPSKPGSHSQDSFHPHKKRLHDQVHYVQWVTLFTMCFSHLSSWLMVFDSEISQNSFGDWTCQNFRHLQVSRLSPNCGSVGRDTASPISRYGRFLKKLGAAGLKPTYLF